VLGPRGRDGKRIVGPAVSRQCVVRSIGTAAKPRMLGTTTGQPVVDAGLIAGERVVDLAAAAGQAVVDVPTTGQ